VVAHITFNITARLGELFDRWCDDWTPARRTLVACVAAQLSWFTEQPMTPREPEPLDDTHARRK
jgi:hypothetical protein